MAKLVHEMSKIDLASQPQFFSAQIARASRFHLPARHGHRDGSLSVVSGGCEHCSPDYQIRRRTFPYFGLEFVAGGRGTVVLDGKKCRLVPGTFFTYGPHVAHHITTDARDPLVKYFVDFQVSDDATRLFRGATLAPGIAGQSSAPAELMLIFDELIRAGLSHTRFTHRICAGLTEVLLLKLAETRVPLGSAETVAFDTYQRCLKELEGRALELRSLRELAERCRIDQAYLCRLFKRFGNESPYQRLLRLKMSHAAARMQQPGVLMKEVAAELGFSDPYHFSRAFKSVFGLSPTQLVRQHERGSRETGGSAPA